MFLGLALWLCGSPHKKHISLNMSEHNTLINDSVDSSFVQYCI